MAGRIAALAERRREERGFPSSSDPEYHKKLCDLMVDTDNWTLNDDSVDALLKTHPQDIQDKAVRQQIARNFRDLATKNSAGNDQGKAIRGLVLYGGKYSVPLLVEILEDRSLAAPAELFDGLASFPDPKGAEALCKQLGNFFNHREAVHALRTMGVAAEDALIKAAPSDDAQTSLAAVELLGELGTKKSLPLLAKAGKSTNLEVRAAAKDATKAIVDRSRTAK
jgi:HEAT repeat protein